MSVETQQERLQKENAELRRKLAAFSKTEQELVVLPNGDLHRGIRPELASMDPEVQIIPEEHGNPLNRAVAQILQNSKGSDTLTCVWCGLQFYGHQSEKEVREHLKQNHKSIVTGGGDKETAEVLMATLSEAQTQLAQVKGA